ncbi:MAG: hypothetical protein M3Q10_03095 [Chloroflexota bacterium]|nr:hypothetical protein [Chloroflexota bacterium]
MTDHLRCSDPWGREILLTRERWFGHILARHPEFHDREDLVREALTAPDLVNLDRQRPMREVFYRASPLPYPYTDLLVRVVVKFYAAGEVTTAHFIGEPHREETRKWP